jgi:hypothetical protein
VVAAINPVPAVVHVPVAAAAIVANPPAEDVHVPVAAAAIVANPPAAAPTPTGNDADSPDRGRVIQCPFVSPPSYD